MGVEDHKLMELRKMTTLFEYITYTGILWASLFTKIHFVTCVVPATHSTKSIFHTVYIHYWQPS